MQAYNYAHTSADNNNNNKFLYSHILVRHQ